MANPVENKVLLSTTFMSERVFYMLEQGMKPENRSPPPSRTSALNFAAMSPRGYKLMIHSMSTRATSQLRACSTRFTLVAHDGGS